MFIKEIAVRYKDAEKITLVMDNLNTHKPASLYEVYSPEEAKRIWDRFEFVYTPKHTCVPKCRHSGMQAWQLAQYGGDRITCIKWTVFKQAYLNDEKN